jgi:hypothetical protein
MVLLVLLEKLVLPVLAGQKDLLELLDHRATQGMKVPPELLDHKEILVILVVPPDQSGLLDRKAHKEIPAVLLAQPE